MKPTSILTFGKYKGQPVEVLAQDEKYLEWLKAQDWFRSKHQNIYAIVINNFHVPSDTPESNRMQIRFNDNEYCKKVAYLFTDDLLKPSFDGEIDCRYEEDGLDVLIKSSHFDLQKEYHIYIEIKPIVSDDYPAILRQIIHSTAYLKYKNRQFGKDEEIIGGMMFGLLIENYSGSISESDLWDYFIKSDIKVYFSREIDELEMEFSEEKKRWFAIKQKLPGKLEAYNLNSSPNKNQENSNSKNPQLKLFE